MNQGSSLVFANPVPCLDHFTLYDCLRDRKEYAYLDRRQIGSWYRKSEISRRTTLFWFSSVGGQMLSGYIQAGLYDGLTIPDEHNLTYLSDIET